MGLEAKIPPLESIGSYDILAKIAEGGMGTVYKAQHRETGEVVAIKIVPPTAARNPTLLKRFEREFMTAQKIDHPNVVKALEFNGTCATPFLVMEFVDGESVGQRIERHGCIPEDEAVRMISQVSQGLHRAHKQNLIHRDVKPDNILLTKDGVAKLTDLGLVKNNEDDFNLTRTGRGLGTPHFMAPEQFRDAKGVDIRCDIYSLGATLYMMITGDLPFGQCTALECFMKKMRNDIPPPRELVPSLSERVDWAIRRAMSPSPDARPESCREFVEDLYGKSVRPVGTSTSDSMSASDSDLWYLVYRDETGESHTVKGGTEGIRKALREGLLGDATNIVACRRHKQGPFLDLRSFPEFRDLLIAPEALPAPSLTPMRNPTPPRTPMPPSGRWPSPNDTPTANLGSTPQSHRFAIPGGELSARMATSRSARTALPSSRRADETPDRTAVPVVTASAPTEANRRLLYLPLAGRRSGFELVMWLGLLVIAIGTGLTMYHYFAPK
jgi:serine/threonine protein kinase